MAFVGHHTSFLEAESSGQSGSEFVEANHVFPGEVLTTDGDFMPGHGTMVVDGKLIATLSGSVEKINKLISVKPLKMRYTGEVGDVLVGRVVEVGPKRWKVDVNSRQDAVLMLSAITLPGGIQRRRTTSDELNMRSFFLENDLISCEVQQLHSDGSMALYTRSLKYGKLEGGQFIVVPHTLIKRSKSHFHQLPCGIFPTPSLFSLFLSHSLILSLTLSLSLSLTHTHTHTFLLLFRCDSCVRQQWIYLD